MGVRRELGGTEGHDHPSPFASQLCYRRPRSHVLCTTAAPQFHHACAEATLPIPQAAEKMKPPYVPRIANPEDTRNFDRINPRDPRLRMNSLDRAYESDGDFTNF